MKTFEQFTKQAEFPRESSGSATGEFLRRFGPIAHAAIENCTMPAAGFISPCSISPAFARNARVLAFNIASSADARTGSAAGQRRRPWARAT